MRFHLPQVALGLAMAGLASGIATGQDADRQQGLKDKLEKKLASDFLKKADWITDYDAARAKAAKSGEVIFAYFTRSYAP